MPKVSVVIPAFNADKFVGEAISSVLSQTLRDLELIVIDDGSTDYTLREIEKAAGTDKRVTVVSRENRGIAKTPNEGIEMSQSPWIAFLDADDLCRPTRLASQIQLATENSLNVVGSQIESFGQRQAISNYPSHHADIVHQLYVWKNPIANPSVLIDRNWLASRRYPEHRAHGQDYALWLMLTADPSVRFGNHPEPLVMYRTHAAQNTANNLERLYKACKEALRDTIQEAGIMDEQAMAIHEAAFRNVKISKPDEFLQYSEWLVLLRDYLTSRHGASLEIYEYWRKLYKKSANSQPYVFEVGKRLGAGSIENMLNWLKVSLKKV